MDGDAKDIARECVDRHEANGVGTKKCGEMVHCSTAIVHVVMTLEQFNVILKAQDSNP